MIRSYKTDGIILSRRNSGEADKILTVFTPYFGKKKLLAKGIRRTKSKRAPYLELFSLVELLVYQSSKWDLVTEVKNKRAFSHLRGSLERVGFGYVGLELVDRFTAENQESFSLFQKLYLFLDLLDNINTTRNQAVFALSQFKEMLLLELGFIDAKEKPVNIDYTIEQILESRLKSPLLLTNIQRNL